MNAAYQLARAELGVREQRAGHSADIVQYFADVGHAWVKDDETAWCAAFVGAMLKRAGVPHTGKLNARSYLDWGDPVTLSGAREGDLVIFSRDGAQSWKGHVAFLVRVNGQTLTVLGGNQSDQVCEAEYARSRVVGVRRLAQWDKPKRRSFAQIILNILKGFKK